MYDNRLLNYFMVMQFGEDLVWILFKCGDCSKT